MSRESAFAVMVFINVEDVADHRVAGLWQSCFVKLLTDWGW